MNSVVSVFKELILTHFDTDLYSVASERRNLYAFSTVVHSIY